MKKFILTLLLWSVYLDAASLEIVYEERIPYIQVSTKSIEGLVATPIMNALTQANIEYQLKQKPSKRHLYEIKANQKPLCAIGWFKNPDRETFGKFTLPLYQDKAMGIVARNDRKTEFSGASIDTLFEKEYSVLTKASYSYGKFLDDKLKESSLTQKEVYANNEKMLLLIEKKRADFMFISQEEAALLLNKKYQVSLSFYAIKGMPKGNKRYLICSQKVSDATIDAINQYLK